MRLIDADKLKEELSQQWFIDILLTKTNSNDMFSALAEKVDSQSTAYDVDKVVEQLDEYITKIVGKKSALYQTIIGIVKAGGNNDN